MSAKEMFEQLGYEQTITQYSIKYYSEENSKYSCWKKIVFNLDEETFFADDTYGSMNIDIQTFKVIHQQLKELGWLDE